MSISTAINLFLEEYPVALKQKFSGHPVADFIRNEIPSTLRELLGFEDRYIVHGSAGQGNWAKVPWIAIYDRFVTESAQEGFYLVYLVKEDFSGVYLSLNQGVTTVRQLYGSDAKVALRARASDYIARLGKISNEFISGPIDLSVKKPSDLGAFYEAGAICSKFYKRGNIPDDKTLENDLRELVNYYFRLVIKDLSPASSIAIEDDEQNLNQEDLTKIREHKRIERNRKLSEAAKKIHGYKCKACGFDFSERYGEIGKSYIEAHHLTPLHTLKGQTVTLDPKNDFSVLCSNCHRMIHRSEFVDKVEEFKANYLS